MRTLIALAALAMFLCACADAETGQEGVPTFPASLPRCDVVPVVRVVDGDTVVVEVGGDEEHVRYIGIDTPETVAPDQPVEPFGPEASERNKELLEGGWLCLERDISNRDQYDRLLRYPWLPDGRMASEILVEEGLATVVTYPPDVKYHDDLLLPAQDRAQEAGAGIWE